MLHRAEESLLPILLLRIPLLRIRIRTEKLLIRKMVRFQKLLLPPVRLEEEKYYWLGRDHDEGRTVSSDDTLSQWQDHFVQGRRVSSTYTTSTYAASINTY